MSQQGLPRVISTAVLSSISHPSFQGDIPKVSPSLWDKISVHEPANEPEIERLEFLGDALMYACIGMELYESIPNGTPHMYTQIRSSLHANLTFTHLAHTIGVAFGGGNVKNIGDAFEAILGGYYTEKGFDALYQWTKRTYAPIIDAAVKAFDKYQNDNSSTLSGTRNRSTSLASTSTSNPPATPSTRRKGKGRTSFSSSSISSPISLLSPPLSSPSAGPSSLEQRSMLNRPDPLSIDTGRPPQGLADILNSIPSPPTPTPPPSYMFGTDTPTSPLVLRTQSPGIRLPSQNRTPSIATPLLVTSTREAAVAQVPPQIHPIRAGTYSEDPPLPPFWEALRTPEGLVFFVDHQNMKTTWEDPRYHLTPSTSSNTTCSTTTVPSATGGTSSRAATSPDASAPSAPRRRAYVESDEEEEIDRTGWGARLMAGVPDLPDSRSPSPSPSPSPPISPLLSSNPILTHVGRAPATPTNTTATDSRLVPSTNPFPDLNADGYSLGNPRYISLGPLPDFWELRRAEDGWEYFIDHVGAAIIRKAY